MHTCTCHSRRRASAVASFSQSQPQQTTVAEISRDLDAVPMVARQMMREEPTSPTSSAPLTTTKMNVTEIRLLVAKLLCPSDFRSCALVCKEWNDSFTPLLYSEINPLNSKSAGIARHCVHACKLTLSMRDPVVDSLLAAPATHVRELDVDEYPTDCDAVPLGLVSLLQQNPKIDKLTFRFVRHHVLEYIISLCPNLRQVAIHNLHFYCEPPTLDSNNWWSFWGICQRLTRLELNIVSALQIFPGQPSELGRDNLPAMRHLTINATHCSVFKQIRLISACPNLETLSWQFDFDSHVNIQLGLETLLTLFRSLCGLQEFSFRMPRVYYPHKFGEDWTHVLMEVFPRLKRLDDPMRRCDDSKEGLVQGQLSKHFESLVELNIKGWSEVSSADNHLILTSCRGLERFESVSYQIGQIPALSRDTLTAAYQCSKSGLGPLDWVCTRLSTIVLGFTHETPEKSRIMFDQLCCMRDLRVVYMTRGNSRALDPMLIRWDDEVSAKSLPSHGPLIS